MTENNAKQAWFPDGAEVLREPDRHRARLHARGRADCALFFCMPGVPREMMRMMDEQVLPRVARARLGAPAWLRARLLRTFGMGESTLDAELSPTSRRPVTSCSASAPRSPTTICGRSRARATEAQADALLDRVCDAIRARLGPLVYGEGERDARGRWSGGSLRERGAHARGGRVVHGRR